MILTKRRKYNVRELCRLCELTDSGLTIICSHEIIIMGRDRPGRKIITHSQGKVKRKFQSTQSLHICPDLPHIKHLTKKSNHFTSKFKHQRGRKLYHARMRLVKKNFSSHFPHKSILKLVQDKKLNSSK